jgi:hypothetical protein
MPTMNKRGDTDHISDRDQAAIVTIEEETETEEEGINKKTLQILNDFNLIIFKF